MANKYDPIASLKIPAQQEPVDEETFAALLKEETTPEAPVAQEDPAQSKGSAATKGKRPQGKASVPSNFLATPVDLASAAANASSQAPEESPHMATSVKANVLRTYVAANDKNVSWRGQMIRVKAGDEFTEESHGPNAWHKLTDAGIKFKYPYDKAP